MDHLLCGAGGGEHLITRTSGATPVTSCCSCTNCINASTLTGPRVRALSRFSSCTHQPPLHGWMWRRISGLNYPNVCIIPPLLRCHSCTSWGLWRSRFAPRRYSEAASYHVRRRPLLSGKPTRRPNRLEVWHDLTKNTKLGMEKSCLLIPVD